MHNHQLKLMTYFFLIGLVATACGDDSASSTTCVQNPAQCPSGTRCMVDEIGNAFCGPITPIDGTDVLVLTDDMGTSNTGGTGGMGGTAGNTGGAAGNRMGGSSGAGGQNNSGGTAGQAGATGNGGSSSGGTAGSNAGGGGGSDNTCRDLSILLKPSRGVANTARIMLAVDRSGSIIDWNGWNAIEAGIADTLNLLGEGVQFGLTLFPSPTGGAGVRDDCTSAQLNQTVGYDNTDDILRFLDIGGPQSNQGTPTSTAIQAAGDHLLEAPTGADYILLVTDGAPNCNAFSNEPSRHDECICTTGSSCFLFDDNYMCLDEARTTTLIQRYADAGIKTIVLGITVDTPSISSIPCPANRTCGPAQSCSCDSGNGCPGNTTGQCQDELRPTLRAFAQAGGASNNGDFYEVSNLNDLQSAITTTAASVRPCTFDLEDIANVNGALTVTIDGNEIANDPNRADGWYAEGDILTFYGSACVTIRDGRAHAIAASCGDD